jgi:hypothetical protein
MKRFPFVITSMILIAWYAYPAAARTGSNAFDKLKALAGEWEAKTSTGEAVRVTYQIVSGGSAVMETIQDGSASGMITVYHPDGEAIMVTHYCSVGNQPRMRAVAPRGEVKSLKFSFVDVTNLSKPSAAHMKSLTLTFQDADHIMHEWTYSEGGKDATEVFKLERKKRL